MSGGYLPALGGEIASDCRKTKSLWVLRERVLSPCKHTLDKVPVALYQKPEAIHLKLPYVFYIVKFFGLPAVGGETEIGQT